jgi:hypothetical protein
MRRVRVVLVVGVLVVLAVGGGPPDHGALPRHAAADRKERRDRTTRVERLVRVQPVVADGDAEARDHVHAEEEREVDPVEPSAPGEHHRGDERDRRHDDGGHRHATHETGSGVLGLGSDAVSVVGMVGIGGTGPLRSMQRRFVSPRGSSGIRRVGSNRIRADVKRLQDGRVEDAGFKRELRLADVGLMHAGSFDHAGQTRTCGPAPRARSLTVLGAEVFAKREKETRGS